MIYKEFLIAIIIILVIILIYQYYYGQVHQRQYLNERELIQWIKERRNDDQFKKKLNDTLKEIKLNDMDEKIKKDITENSVRGFLIGGLFGGFPGAAASCVVYGTMGYISGNNERIQLKKQLNRELNNNY